MTTVIANPRGAKGWADAADWTKPNTEIAKEAGVSRERVRQVRARRGEPEVDYQAWKNADLDRTLRGLDTGAMAIPELMAVTGKGRHATLEQLKRLGLPYKRRSKKGRRFPRKWKHPWDEIDWEGKYDAQIARDLGISGPQVTMARRRLGKPKGPDGRKVSPHRRPQVAVWPTRVLRFLAHNPGWHTVRAVTEGCGYAHPKTAVWTALRGLSEAGAVQQRVVPRPAGEIFGSPLRNEYQITSAGLTEAKKGSPQPAMDERNEEAQE